MTTNKKTRPSPPRAKAPVKISDDTRQYNVALAEPDRAICGG
jgi:hypothetical protein